MKGKVTLWKKVSPMWRTLAFCQWTSESPSVWASATWTTWSVSPLRWRVTPSSKVTTGRAPAGEAGHLVVQGGDELLARHPGADVAVGDDHRAAAAHRLVAAGMVAMPVGVDDEADRIGIDGGDRGEDPVAHRRILIVDDDVAVGAVGQADIAAGAEQDGDSGRDLLDLHLDLGKVLLRGRGRGAARAAMAKTSGRMDFPLWMTLQSLRVSRSG